MGKKQVKTGKNQAPKNKRSKAGRKASGPFYCPYCFHRFVFKGAPADHCHAAHKGHEISCIVCKTSHKDFEILCKHFHDAHISDFADDKCGICGFSIDSGSFIPHMTDKHKR